ncbi:RDD family protein [Moheibacter sediminis]|uniref:RDD family protein n=2 Tax=Moheibacter sediminis TaxID=1434700 RepID=A0A1W1ZZD4_9FLAO|nr:RDD family protein [Moheibacter sediminis]
MLGLSGEIWSQSPDNYYDFNTFLEIIYVILLFPVLFYSLWTESVFNGQTVGKMICKIRVVKLNGYHAGFPEYFTRWAFRLVDFWTGMFMILFFIPIFGQETGSILGVLMLFMSGFVAFFSIIRTKKSQRIGDIVAGTTVLKLVEKHSMDITILEDIRESYIPMYSQVIKLTDNDARIIKDTFVIARKNQDYATLKRLRVKLESVMEIEGRGGDAEFIDTVMKDFNYYTQKL